MSEIFNFVDKRLIDIKPPTKGQVMYRDEKEKGLVLRVSYGGKKVFYLYKRFDGRPRLIKIGNFPKISITDARIAVRNLKTKIEKGEYNTKVNSTQKELTFKQLLNKYLDQHIKINSLNPERSIKTILTEMKNVTQIYNKLISSISKQDILDIFNKITVRAPIQANRVIVKLTAIFNKGIEWGILDQNPAQDINKNKEIPRDRYITIEEKDRFFHALTELKNQTMKDIFLLSLFTGARKGNIVSMRWDKISFENKTWSIPAKSNIRSQGSKNGKSILVHLNQNSIDILLKRKENSQSEWVFSSKNNSKSGHVEEPRKAWMELCKKANLKDIRIHDLRHTHASWMAIKGVSLPIIGKALGHRSLQSTARYAHLNDDSVKEAVNGTFNDIKINSNKGD